MKTILKRGTYNTLDEAIDAVNKLIHNVAYRTFVQIICVSETFLGSSNSKYVVLYNEMILENG